MKPKLKSMLVFMAVSFIIFSGCKKSDSHISPSALSAPDSKAAETAAKKEKGDKHDPGTITFNYTGRSTAGFTGSFTASGGPAKEGTALMAVKTVGMEFHCTNTLELSGGTITILSVCQMSDNTGIWYVEKGTGRYKKLQGEGTLVMTFPGSGIIVREVFTGKFLKGHDHNKE
ncbi:hypothetical protein [Terrimonas pollutisoli]|uniref:hypothetical protein n=1 Tax=Terrimonas pollutisoli TaxID=3034147 RepID=UPI0023EDF5D2|nr:hypothetical protein [Terrimonas sp. H1YJ31]